MSTLTETAKAEADRVEGEEPEAPEVEQPAEPEQPEAPAEPEQPEQPAEPAAPPVENLSDTEIQKRFEKAGKEGEKFVAKVQTILGPALMVDLMPSPLDTLPGFVLTQGGEIIDAEAIEATKAALGLNAGPDYQAHPERRTCTMCAGWGDVLSGAKRAGNELLECPNCGGLGYTDANGSRIGATVATNGHNVNAATGEIIEQPHAPSNPVIESLRAQGYTILEPLKIG